MSEIRSEKKRTHILFGKIILFVVCIAICMICIGIIYRNVTAYFAARQYQAQRVAEELAQKKQAELEALNAARLRQQKKEYEAKRLAALAKITQEAEALGKTEKWETVIDFLKHYNGEFAAESSYLRNRLLEKYETLQKQELEKTKEKILHEAAELLLKREYLRAAEKLEPYDSLIPLEVIQHVKSLPEVNQNILKSFQNDLNGLILIHLQDGSTISVKLLNIQKNELIVEQNLNKKSIHITDLQIHEKEKRLGHISPSVKALYLGIEYWNLKDKNRAGAHLRNFSYELGTILQEITGTAQWQLQEQLAEQNIILFLRKYGFDHPAEILKEFLAQRNAEEEIDRRMKKEKDDLVQRYSDSRFLKKEEKRFQMIEYYLNKKLDFLACVPLEDGEKLPELKLPMQKIPPETFWDIPIKQQEYSFAVLPLTGKSKINLVIAAGKQASAWIAFDDDTDFVGKSSVSLMQWHIVKHTVKFNENLDSPELFAIAFKMENGELYYRAACKRKGEILLDKKKYDVQLLHRKAMPDYSKIGDVTIRIFDKTREIPIKNASFTLETKRYFIKGITQNGDHLILR